MENFDELIRSQAISDRRLTPDKFDERNDRLLESLKSMPLKKTLRPVIKICVAALAVSILLSGAAIAAYTLSGGDYFRQLFQSRATEYPAEYYGYMDTDQLDGIASSTVGRVVDTDELAIDVLGVLVSGNTAEFDFKVTAKKLETVLYDTGIEPLMNYRFHDFSSVFSWESGLKTGTVGHVYCDQDEMLAPNQFIIRYTLMSETPLKDQTYRVTYTDFGYFDFDEADQFSELYTGSWSFDIVFDPQNDTSQTIYVNHPMRFGGYSFTLESVTVTPLSCSCIINIDTAYYDRLDDRWMEVYEALRDGTADFALNLSDGTVLDRADYYGGADGGALGYEINAVFNVPLNIGDVVSVTIGGSDVLLG